MLCYAFTVSNETHKYSLTVEEYSGEFFQFNLNYYLLSNILGLKLTLE